MGARMVETSEFLVELIQNGEFPVDELRRIDATIPYHQPCQVKSQGIGKPAIEVVVSPASPWWNPGSRAAVSLEPTD